MFKKLLLIVLLAAPLSMCAQKFAHFDYASIIQSMPEAKAVQAELETLYKQYQTELENMQKEFQTKMEKYQKEDTDATPANIRDRHNQEMQPVTQKIMDAVNAVAQEGSYVYIIDKNGAQGAGIVINETLSTDVTSTIMKKLGITASAAKPAAATGK